MPQTLSGAYQFVEYVPGSPDESFDFDRTQATRVYDVNWGDRFAIARELIGYAGLGVGGSFPNNYDFISRKVPHHHPSAIQPDGTKYLWATRILKCEGIGFTGMDGFGFSAIASYNKARLTVQYNTVPYEILTDEQLLALDPTPTTPDERLMKRYVSFAPRPHIDMLNINRGVFKRVDSTTPKMPVQIGTFKSVVSHGFQVTWHQVPLAAVPLKLLNPHITDPSKNFAIDRCLGHVNHGVFLGYPAGTVLLVGCELKPYRSSFGYRIYDITYTFKIFNPKDTSGHQMIFLHIPYTAIPQNATSWDWVEVTTDGETNLLRQANGKSIYDWQNLSTLFKPINAPGDIFT